MKLFSCQRCEQVLFFENTVCTSCGTSCAYSVEAESLVAVPEGKAAEPFDLEGTPHGKHPSYRKCKNFIEHDACNWLVAAEDADASGVVVVSVT